MDPETDVNVETEAPSASTVDTAATTTANPLDGLRDAVQKGFEASQKGGTPQPEAETTTVVPEDPEKGEPEAKETEPKPEAPPKPEADDKGPVPYTRFQEVVHARQKAEAELEQSQPLLAAYNSFVEYCDQAGITNDNWQFFLQVAAADAKDPTKALSLLKDRYSGLMAANGEAPLPKDLADLVEKGEMSEAVARRLAAAEAKTGLAEKRVTQTREQVEAQKRAQYEADLQDAMGSWLKHTQGTVPEFKPKSDPSEPDGLYEFWLYKLNTEGQRTQFRTAGDLVALAEKVLTSLRPKAQANGHRNGKVVTSRQSTSTTVKSQPKTMADAVAAGARAAGIHWTPPQR